MQDKRNILDWEQDEKINYDGSPQESKRRSVGSIGSPQEGKRKRPSVDSINGSLVRNPSLEEKAYISTQPIAKRKRAGYNKKVPRTLRFEIETQIQDIQNRLHFFAQADNDLYNNEQYIFLLKQNLNILNKIIEGYEPQSEKFKKYLETKIAEYSEIKETISALDELDELRKSIQPRVEEIINILTSIQEVLKNAENLKDKEWRNYKNNQPVAELLAQHGAYPNMLIENEEKSPQTQSPGMIKNPI